MSCGLLITSIGASLDAIIFYCFMNTFFSHHQKNVLIGLLVGVIVVGGLCTWVSTERLERKIDSLYAIVWRSELAAAPDARSRQLLANKIVSTTRFQNMLPHLLHSKFVSASEPKPGCGLMSALWSIYNSSREETGYSPNVDAQIWRTMAALEQVGDCGVAEYNTTVIPFE